MSSQTYKIHKKVINKGEISVYTVLMVAVMLVLVLAIFKGIRTFEARARCYQAMSLATENVKGDYQPDLFRRYHLLAVDQTYYGRGEAYMEERIRENLEYNLNSKKSLYAFSVDQVEVTEAKGLMDDSLRGMKEQIGDYMKQKLPADLVSELFAHLINKDNSQDAEGLWQNAIEDSKKTDCELDMEMILSQECLDGIGILDELRDSGTEDVTNLTLAEIIERNQEEGFFVDPRLQLDSIQKGGILHLVMPDRATGISTTPVDLSNVPSATYATEKNTFSIPSFSGIDNINNLMDLVSISNQINCFDVNSCGADELYGIAYALDSFQSVSDTFYKSDDEKHVLNYELEYILIGKNTDKKNVSAVADRLLLLRMIPNACYAFTNETMKTEAMLAAAIILVPIDCEFLIKPVTYVFLACWAYAESIFDVKQLFEGETVAFVKDEKTWNLSLSGIADLATTERKNDCEFGINYAEYMAFMLAVMPDRNHKYYRMLDIMELNIQEDITQFEIENCIYEYQIQAQISEGGHSWYLDSKGSLTE